MEQHRLKCSIASNVSLANSNSGLTDVPKNINMYPSNGGIIMDSDRQWLHVSNSVRQFIDNVSSFKKYLINAIYIFRYHNWLILHEDLKHASNSIKNFSG